MAEPEIAEQFIAAPICTAAEAPQRVPDTPGYYAIFIDEPSKLPKPFRDPLVQKGTTLIYIGIATGSLLERLVKQDLLHQKPSTFFRAIGAILGYRPPPGSLAGMKNQHNYRFSVSDTNAIITWIREHLSVNWSETTPAVAEFEQSLIRKHSPVINTDANPSPVQELAALRYECRIIARTAHSRTET